MGMVTLWFSLFDINMGCIVSGSAINGMTIMLAFGLGTLPAMLAIGTVADKLKLLLQNSYFKRGNALFIIIYGMHTGYIAINQIW